MVVMEKKKDIGILKAIGATRKQVMKLFMLEGAFIGIGGTLLGLIGGLLACLLLKVYPLHIPGGGSVYYIENLPVNTQGLDVGPDHRDRAGRVPAVGGLSAWQASRQDPVDAIRYE